jgi:Ribonuclease G/E
MQIARELRLRDIGGIIIVDFIDMSDDCEYDFRYNLITDVTKLNVQVSPCVLLVPIS